MPHTNKYIRQNDNRKVYRPIYRPFEDLPCNLLYHLLCDLKHYYNANNGTLLIEIPNVKYFEINTENTLSKNERRVCCMHWQ